MSTDTQDRELLEAAARAAGIGWDRDSEVWFGEPFVRNDWNPLTDDGDALRLAVKLGISTTMRVNGCTATDMGLIDAYERYCNDPYAATRRAIVRAAAALAKGE